MLIMFATLMALPMAVLAAEGDKPKDEETLTGRWVVIETSKGVIKFAL